MKISSFLNNVLRQLITGTIADQVYKYLEGLMVASAWAFESRPQS